MAIEGDILWKYRGFFFVLYDKCWPCFETEILESDISPSQMTDKKK